MLPLSDDYFSFWNSCSILSSCHLFQRHRNLRVFFTSDVALIPMPFYRCTNQLFEDITQSKGNLRNKISFNFSTCRSTLLMFSSYEYTVIPPHTMTLQHFNFCQTILSQMLRTHLNSLILWCVRQQCSMKYLDIHILKWKTIQRVIKGSNFNTIYCREG